MKWVSTKAKVFGRLFSSHSILPWIMIVAIIPLVVVIYLSYTIGKTTLQQELSNVLLTITQNKVLHVERHMAERRDDAIILSETPSLVDFARQLLANTKEAHAASQTYGLVDGFLKRYLEEAGYTDLQIISPKGKVLYIAKDRRWLGRNYYKAPYNKFQQAKIFDRTNTLMEISLEGFSDRRGRAVGTYVATPIFYGGKILAVLMLQMSNRDVYSVINDYTGLGRTGESVVATINEGQVVITAPLRYASPAVKNRRLIGAPQLQFALIEAARGNMGKGIIKDYRGKSVIAAWRYLPTLGWGLLVKIDTKEAFASVLRLRREIIILGLISLMLVTLIANVVARALQRMEERTESLLLNILPKSIAERLKAGEQVIAENFSEVSVVFADIVGFTELASDVQPEDLVAILNDIFSLFDDLADGFGLEKIKTIGDSYLAVAGVPYEKENHAQAAVEMALGMLAALTEYNQSHGTHYAIRIGINSGPVTAGVIGTKKFSYDLWGNAVNVASRMESHGMPGKIQITQSTHDRLDGKYLVEDRGEITVKGKGTMRAFFLLGRA